MNDKDENGEERRRLDRSRLVMKNAMTHVRRERYWEMAEHGVDGRFGEWCIAGESGACSAEGLTK